jgi:hypothetical protein
MTARRKRRLPPIVIAAGLMIGVSGGAIAAANQANEQLAGTCPAAFEAASWQKLRIPVGRC